MQSYSGEDQGRDAIAYRSDSRAVKRRRIVDSSQPNQFEKSPISLTSEKSELLSRIVDKVKVEMPLVRIG